MLIAYRFPPTSLDNQTPVKAPTNITVNVCAAPAAGNPPGERPIVVVSIEP